MHNAQLIKKLKEGDHHAYKFIFDHYYALMGAIAYEYVEDYYISQNIVEDVMMSIWEKREQLIISTSVKSYLTINASITYEAGPEKRKYSVLKVKSVRQAVTSRIKRCSNRSSYRNWKRK